MYITAFPVRKKHKKLIPAPLQVLLDKINTHEGRRVPYMVTYVAALQTFVVALIISMVIIYAIARLFGEKEGLFTAFLAALVGTVIYTIVYYLLGQGLIAALIAGIFWLLALQHLYKIGWIKSLAIAVVVWIVASIVGIFLPTISGPL
jgi:hypothetical protein